jgi:hypothetical protein
MMDDGREATRDWETLMRQFPRRDPSYKFVQPEGGSLRNKQCKTKSPALRVPETAGQLLFERGNLPAQLFGGHAPDGFFWN